MTYLPRIWNFLLSSQIIGHMAADDRENRGHTLTVAWGVKGSVPMAASTGLLLLVEDEVVIRAVLEEALTDGGYEVATAGDADEALALLEADAQRFRGVISDIRLGSSLDGWEVGRRARELAPTIPVVYMSGDSAGEWASKGGPNSIMVAKPFAMAQILTAISNLLISADAHP